MTDSAPHAPRSSLRVLIVARPAIVRAGLRSLVGDIDNVVVVGATAAADDALDLVTSQSADVVLAAWEVVDPDRNHALTDVLADHGVPLVLLGEAPPTADISAAVRAGARGFLLAEASAEEVEAALWAASRGLLVLSPVLGRGLPALAMVGPAEILSPNAGDSPLTEREGEVLGLLALGLANKAIARRLNVSDHTVKFHVGSILAKLDAASRTEAVTRAARRGLLAL